MSVRIFALALTLALAGCGAANEPLPEAPATTEAPGAETAGSNQEANVSDLQDFAQRYAAAWSSGDPTAVAAFHAEDGALIVNGGEPAEGRAGITVEAQGFMTAFPDMQVLLDRLEVNDDGVFFHWTLIGTNTGPCGTGNKVNISGYEQWTMNADGLIARSLGNFDADEYARQLAEGVE